MIPRDLRNIHATRNSCRDALPSTNLALKLPQYFYSDGEASWSLLPSLIFLRSGSTVQPENTYSRNLMVKKAKKGEASILITATTNVHLPMPVSTDLTTEPDLVLTNSKGNDWVHSWSM